MIRKNLMKSLSVIMAAMMAIMTVACGSNTVDTTAESAVEMAAEEQAGEDALANSVVSASNIASAESEAGKVETVYVTADANGAVNDVIVSEWLKNAAASPEIADTTELKDIVNVKGDETFTDNGDGTLTWNAAGSDIYYQGTTNKQLPVNMKITYTLDGKEITPEELAGKSGRVTIRFEYENNDKQTVEVNGKEVDVYTPFAMVSGMMLDSDKFTNVEISNGKVISDGGNIIVMGVALPGLKESLDISDDKWDELEDADEIKDRLSNSFEITADTTDFELGMTITMASSDILSDFGMTDLSGSDKLDDLKSDMEDLNDGSNKLVDGTKELKDGTTKFRDGVGELYNGSKELKDGTLALKDGTSELYNGTGSLYDGIVSYTDGVSKVDEGVSKLADGASSAKDGSGKLTAGAKSAKEGADALVAGVKALSDGVEPLSGSAKSLAELKKKAEYGYIAYTWLNGDRPCTPAVAAILSSLSEDGQTISQSQAEAIRAAGKSIMASATTTSVTNDSNYAELDTDVKIGEVTLEEPKTEDPKVEEPKAEEPKVEEPKTEETKAAEADAEKKAVIVDENVPKAGPTDTDDDIDDDGTDEEDEDVKKTEETDDKQTLILEENENDTELDSASLLSTKKVVKSVSPTALLGNSNTIPVNPQTLKAALTYYQLLGATESLNKIYTSGIKDLDVSKFSDLTKGLAQLSSGSQALASGLNDLYTGMSALDAGLGTLSSGAGELKNGTSTLASNNGKLVDGAYQLSDGARQLYDGATKLNDGAGELYDGVGELNDGAIKLDDGVKELLDGVTKFDDEGIKKIYEAFDGDLSDFTDRLEAIKEAGSSYKTFGGSADDVDSSVKFIIKTDSIKSL